MDSETIPDTIQSLYECPRIAGPRLSRLDERNLGAFTLDSATAWNLGVNNIGVFVGNTPYLGRTIEILQGLEDTATDAPIWVIVAATKIMAVVIFQRWFLSTGRRVSKTTLKMPQTRANIWLCTPESIKKVVPPDSTRIAGILLIDAFCNVHKARGMESSGFPVRNDRPQSIAYFRSKLVVNQWSPPLFVLTTMPAKSVWTETVSGAYNLDALWFLDGSQLSCREQKDDLV